MFRARWTPHFLCILPALFLLFSTPLSCAETDTALLQEISFTQKSDTEETVTFKMNGPLTPKIFTVKGNTPKIVVDFYDTRTAPSIKRLMDSRGKLISAIRVGTHTENQQKTRVVLDLVPAAEYTFSQDFEALDNTLRLTVVQTQQDGEKKQDVEKAPEKTEKLKAPEKLPADIPSPTKTKEAVPAPVSKEKSNNPPSAVAPVDTKKTAVVAPSSLPVSIQSISVDKNLEKGEKILFTLKNFQPPKVIGIEEGIPRVICDFTSATLAETIPEIIQAQGNFIQQVRVEKKADSSVRITLELVANHHYDLEQFYFQEDDLYVLLVKPSQNPQLKK